MWWRGSGSKTLQTGSKSSDASSLSSKILYLVSASVRLDLELNVMREAGTDTLTSLDVQHSLRAITII